jgi:hypothetical protein
MLVTASGQPGVSKQSNFAQVLCAVLYDWEPEGLVICLVTPLDRVLDADEQQRPGPPPIRTSRDGFEFVGIEINAFLADGEEPAQAELMQVIESLFKKKRGEYAKRPQRGKTTR